MDGSTAILDMLITQKFGNIIQDNSKPPKTRAVCSAIGGFNVQLSNLISPIIEALADEMDGKCEVISSEDALFCIDRFNRNQTKPQPECAASINKTKEYLFNKPDVIAENVSDEINNIKCKDFAESIEEFQVIILYLS